MSAVETPTPGTRVTVDEISRLSVEQYHRMIREGILSDDDPVELLEGWLVRKMPKNPPHRLVTRRTRDALERALPSGWFVETQEPITTADSEPEPDVAIIRGTPEDYATRHPGPSEVALVVEVADSTLLRDRIIKRRLYADAGIPVYWVVNLIERCVEVYSAPSGSGDGADYSESAIVNAEGAIAVPLEGAEIGRLAVGLLLT